jgi:hypothetical protein
LGLTRSTPTKEVKTTKDFQKQQPIHIGASSTCGSHEARPTGENEEVAGNE